MQHVQDIGEQALVNLLRPWGLQVHLVAAGCPIPGSYWGEPEAGLRADCLYLREDTPVHSALHEASHFICMGDERRRSLDTDAGGDYAEEDAVCYLQILLADRLPGINVAGICTDMDAWGYTFRLGSAARWFDHDADDARDWLQRRGLLSRLDAVAIAPETGASESRLESAMESGEPAALEILSA
jgi:hypothetical protein